MTNTLSTVKGTDIEPGQVFKLDGRWVRLVQWADPNWDRSLRFARVAPADVDPRMALLYSKIRRLRTGKYVFADREYPTRVQAAPEYEWVTKLLEKEDLS